MRVILKDIQITGRPPLPLTGPSPEEGVSAFRLDHGRSQAVSEYIEALAVKGRDFGNEWHKLTFSVTRTHANAAAASLFAITHPSQIPPLCEVHIDHFTPDGRPESTSVLLDAIVNCKQTDWIGLSTTCAYEITGGQLTGAK